jgi:hypothetical protein
MRPPSVRLAAVAGSCLVWAGAALSAGATGSAAPSPPSTGAHAAKEAVTRFDRTNFSNSTKIDNTWWPLAPGTRFTWEGRANRGGGRLRHRVVTTITDLTKVIDGIRTVVLWERDINAGHVVEAELAFFAQDDDGTVWGFGEYPEEYERGRLQGAPSTWIVGRAGAKAGIAMPADPRVGTPSYLQGFAPAVDFADRARVLRERGRICVPHDCFDRVLEFDEWNPSEPGAHERKFYAPGVGTVRVGAAGGKEQEALRLTNVERLDAATIARVRERARALDRRAYRVRPGVYGRTPRATRAAAPSAGSDAR